MERGLASPRFGFPTAPAKIIKRRANLVRWSRFERTFPLPAFLRDDPLALPLSDGQDRAEGLHRARRPARRRPQRRARPDRLPAQPERRLPAVLPGLRRLHL